MADFEKITDEKMEDVVGGVSRDEALNAALKHAGFKKEELAALLKQLNEEDLEGVSGGKIGFRPIEPKKLADGVKVAGKVATGLAGGNLFGALGDALGSILHRKDGNA